MINKMLIGMFIITGMISCTNENGITNELNGEWNLVGVSCECRPVDLEIGEHIWTFDLSENKLYVMNNVTEQLHTILETGIYDIHVSENKVAILTVESIAS